VLANLKHQLLQLKNVHRSSDSPVLKLRFSKRRFPLYELFQVLNLLVTVEPNEKVYERLTQLIESTWNRNNCEMAPLLLQDPAMILIKICMSRLPQLAEFQYLVCCVMSIAVVQAIINISFKLSNTERQAWKIRWDSGTDGFHPDADTLISCVLQSLPSNLYADDEDMMDTSSAYQPTIFSGQSIMSCVESFHRGAAPCCLHRENSLVSSIQ